MKSAPTRQPTQKLTATVSALIVCISVLVSFGTWWVLSDVTQRQLELKFQGSTDQITSLVESRMDLYVDVVYGAQGLFAASERVSKDEWQAYTNELHLSKNYAGISAMSYIQRVPRDAVASYPYQIYPFTEKSEYYPFTYLSANLTSTTSALGFDVSSEEKRATTLRRAASTGSPVATPIVLTITDKLPSFSVYAPIYQKKAPVQTIQEREKALEGVVVVSFRVKELFAGLTAAPSFNRNVAVEVYDVTSLHAASPETLIFSTSSSTNGVVSEPRHRLSRSTQIEIGGRTWTLYFSDLPGYGSEEGIVWLPWAALVIGLVLSALVFSVISSLRGSEQRALVLADEMTADLQKERNRLMEATAKDEAILGSISDGLVVADKKGNFLFFNEAARKILGVGETKKESSEWSGVYNTFYPDGKTVYPSDQLPLVRAMRGESVDKELLFIRNPSVPNGVFISITARPVKTANNKQLGGVVVFRDMTHEQEVDRAKTEFVSLASHQLRTPLSAIKWYAEMLLAGDAGKLKHEQNDYVNEIHTGNQRMIDLVNALLNVSRIDLGTFAIEPEPIRLEEIAESVLTEMTQQIHQKKMHVQKRYAPGLPTVNADPKLMRIVLQNLFTNAVKYTPEEGNVNIEISKNAKDILIQVADTGYGIPKAQQDQIFKKLFRADNVRERETDGTGLGLYIVKSVVEQSGGTIRFESEENKGTTFYITLPLQGMKKKKGTKGLS